MNYLVTCLWLAMLAMPVAAQGAAGPPPNAATAASPAPRLESAVAPATTAATAEAASSRRVDAVPPDKPISEATRKVFDEVFGAEIKAALASPDLAARTDLAARIFEEAQKRSNYPEFVAYALDQVVTLGSGATNCQRLVYAALQTQMFARLRSPRGCLARMMAVAPLVLAESGQTHTEWLAKVWARDALGAAEIVGEAEAVRLIAPVIAAAGAAGQDVPAEVTDYLEGLQFSLALREALQKYEAELARPEARPKAHLVMAAVRLRERRDKEAVARLKSSKEPAAEALAALLDPTTGAHDPLDVARAELTLAEKVEGTYFKLLVLQAGHDSVLRCLEDGGLSDLKQLQADLLKDQIAKAAADLLDEIPTASRRQFPWANSRYVAAGVPTSAAATPTAGAAGAGSGSGAVSGSATAAGTDTGLKEPGEKQTFFTIPVEKGDPSPTPVAPPADGSEPAKPAEPPSAGAGSATTAATTAEAAPAAEPVAVMPAAEQEKLRRMVAYLERMAVCASCSGRGKWTRTERGGGVGGGASPDVRVQQTCADCDGTGRTPARSVRGTLDQVEKLLAEHGTGVPAALRASARQAMSRY